MEERLISSSMIQDAEARRARRFLIGLLPQIEIVTATLERAGDNAAYDRIAKIQTEVREVANQISLRLSG